MKIPKFIRFPHFRGPRTIASRLTWRVVITLLIIYLFAQRSFVESISTSGMKM